MNWFRASIIVLALLVWCSRKTKSATVRKVRQPAAPVPESGEISKARLAELLESNDVEEMASALDQIHKPLSRHHVLTAMVQQLYRDKDEPAIRKKLYHYGQLYLDEFDGIAPAAIKAAASGEVATPVLKLMAIAMEEDQSYDDALEICRMGIKWDLEDGTKTGFAGRMNRLEKKQAAM